MNEMKMEVDEIRDRARRIETKLSLLCEKMEINIKQKALRISIVNDDIRIALPGNDTTISSIRKMLIESQLETEDAEVELLSETMIPMGRIIFYD